MSEALLARGVHYVVLERGEVADNWRTQRWSSLRLNSPGWLNRSLHTEGEPDRYRTAAEVAQRLDEIAVACPVRTRTPVLHLTRSPTGFVLLTPSERIRARTVVVASGDTNVAAVPHLAAKIPVRIHQLHSAHYRRPNDLCRGQRPVGRADRRRAQRDRTVRGAGDESGRPGAAAPPRHRCRGGGGGRRLRLGSARGCATVGPDRPAAAGPRS